MPLTGMQESQLEADFQRKGTVYYCPTLSSEMDLAQRANPSTELDLAQRDMYLVQRDGPCTELIDLVQRWT